MAGEPAPAAAATLSVVSLFSGGGGLDLGLEAAGFSTRFASDIDYHSCETLRMGQRYAREHQLPFLAEAVIEQADVCDLDGEHILQSTGLRQGELALLAGGPPCQAFSVFGLRKGRSDPRGLLPAQYIRLLVELEPQAFVFENVYGLLTIEGGEVFEELKHQLRHPADGLTYDLSWFRLNACDYGVPQSRDRVFVIGSRVGRTVDEIPVVTTGMAAQRALHPGLIPVRTAGQALHGLPPLNGELANHTGRVHSPRIIDRYRGLTFGQRDPKTRINRLDPDRPSFTIIVGSDKGGGKGHVHPYEPREVSSRESARMQTFPDWWAFSGTSRHPIRQVGNAVPPLLAAVIGKTLSEQLFDTAAPSYSEMVAALGQQHLFLDGSLDQLALT